MSRNASLLLAAAIAIVALTGGLFAARMLLDRSGDTQLALAAGTALDPPRPLPAMEFIDHNGRDFSAARLKGRWSLLFFGFTNCPDVCPATLAILAQIEKAAAKLPPADRPQVVLISVDPKRDTPEQLAKYVKFFSPSFVGVTGTQATIDTFARQLGVPVAIHELDNGSYTVDHSATIFLIDPNAELGAVFSPPHNPAVIAEDYRRVVGQPAAR